MVESYPAVNFVLSIQPQRVRAAVDALFCYVDKSSLRKLKVRSGESVHETADPTPRLEPPRPRSAHHREHTRTAPGAMSTMLVGDLRRCGVTSQNCAATSPASG